MTAPALRGRKAAAGRCHEDRENGRVTVRRLRQPVTDKDAVTLKVTDDVAELLNGKLDAMLRMSAGSHPGLHVDRLVLAGVDGGQTPAVLLTHPGLAGCREHRRLLRRLNGAA